jgi:uncharacterized protein YdeI (YjbR/CyaY-like superfamily)
LEITETLNVADREEWRAWLEKHHAGWIDGIQKKTDDGQAAQRFTPRRARSHWTELNKERARRLIKAGKMTQAGYATLPDLAIESFKIPDDILKELQSDPEVWKNFQAFPATYQRIRIGYIEEMRKQPAEFEKRLRNFIEKTRQNKQFGITE